MDYGGILKRSWDITWKNKGLWILGILAGCTAGNGNPSQTSSYQFSRSDFVNVDPYLRSVPEETWILVAIGLVMVFLLVMAAVIVLGILGQAGLIAGVARADETGSVSLGEAWRGGVPHFWKLLGLALLLFLLVLVVALAVGLFTVLSFGLAFLCLLPLICLLIPVGVLIAAYLSLVQNGIVLENLGVFQAFERAWQILRANFWPIVAMALILLLIGLVAGIVMAVPFFLVLFPIVALAVAGSDTWMGILPMLACIVVYFPVLLVVSGILTTFTSGTWTLVFRRLTGIVPMAESVPAPA
ncbi:MAG TPA: hypothetical protein VLL77_08865 [Anaerolineales bacterium]|nr:hypothetical protein [Anaerolineales bacterium]